MAIEVFKRLEIKYIMDSERYKHITDFLTRYMNLDEFNQGGNFYSIANIYYDTVDHNIIRQSVAKPKYKEKLRLRAYGVPELDDKVYLEIKKKYKGIVYKRRVTMKLHEAYDFINTWEVPAEKSKKFVRNQVFQELKHTLNFYNPVPMIYLAYDRIAYFGKSPDEGGPGRDLRISFDFNVRTRRENTGLELGDHGEQLLPGGKVIMEVKSATPLPQWLLDYFAEHGMRRGSFSKYGQEYKRFIKRQLEDGRSIIEPATITGDIKPPPPIQVAEPVAEAQTTTATHTA
ncbi:MAG: polyphosphate polymerase domain-containing protein [Oscillospiraceae bacterium]|nr:polyphosphate polymerase domain-containing protein [Oscillospiraceae bacterium]